MNSLLRKTDIFSSLTPEDFGIVLSMSDQLEFQGDHTIFQPGNISKCFYVIIEGAVVIRTGDTNADQTDIARFLAGDSFGEVGFFTTKPHTARAVTSGDTKLLRFPKDGMTLADISEQWPSMSARLMHSFLADVSTRIRKANALIKNNSPLVRKLKRQVYVDKLTGLNNKTYFEEVLEKTLQDGANIGLLLCKPDNFKEINDAYGHEAGDQVLKFVAESLAETVPTQDMLFRYMGNENAIILPESTYESLREFGEHIRNFLNNLNISKVVDAFSHSLSVSIGLVLSPQHGKSREELIRGAHSLVMESRNRGGNLILFPEDSHDS